MAKPKKLSRLSKECMECKKHCCGKRTPSFFNEKEVRKFIGEPEKKHPKFSFYRNCARSKGVCCFYKNSCCVIYKKRPVDCRTYPLVIDLENGKGVVFIDLNCPAVRKKVVDKKFIACAMKLWKKNWPSKDYFVVNSKDNKAGRYKLITLQEYSKYVKNKVLI